MTAHPNAQFIEQLVATGKVAAIAVGGSRASGMANPGSDLDVYVLTTGRIDADARENIIRAAADQDATIEFANPYWGDEDGFASDGVWHDVVYFDAVWFWEGIDAVVNHHRASEGYSTSFVHTLTHWHPLHDPEQMIARWQQREQTYPEPLVDAIFARNYPVSCAIHSCYRNQIARAVELSDPVAVNHRVAAFLACVFDIAFAHLRVWHPGEKRQLQYLEQHRELLPPDFARHVNEIFLNSIPDRIDQLIPAVDRVVADVATMVNAEPCVILNEVRRLGGRPQGSTLRIPGNRRLGSTTSV